MIIGATFKTQLLLYLLNYRTMDIVKEKIQRKKPSLSINSLNLYISKLKRFVNSKGKLPYTVFKDVPTIMDKVNESKSISTQKSILTSIVVYLSSSKKPNKKLIEQYRKPMLELLSKESKEIFKQEKTNKQREKWITMDDFVDIINKLGAEIKDQDILKKKELTDKQYQLLQDYVILRLYYRYPLRNDISSLQVVKNENNLEKDKNYLLTGKEYKIILQNYKTKRSYGRRDYVLSKPLKSLIKKLLKLQDTGYLLTVINRSKRLTRNNLTLTLQRIFNKHTGKKISSSMLRHIQASELQKDKPSLQEQKENEKEIENKFLHGGLMNQLYAKKD